MQVRRLMHTCTRSLRPFLSAKFFDRNTIVGFLALITTITETKLESYRRRTTDRRRHSQFPRYHDSRTVYLQRVTTVFASTGQRCRLLQVPLLSFLCLPHVRLHDFCKKQISDFNVTWSISYGLVGRNVHFYFFRSS